MSVECHLVPLRLERTLKLAADSAVLVLEETVTNYSARKADFMWGHHPMFGKPVMSGDARIFAPAGCTLMDSGFIRGDWPVRDGNDLAQCPPEDAASSEMFYLHEFTAGWAALVNTQERLGVALAWDLDVFPYAWIWRECGGTEEYPFFGRNYCVAIEPFSNLPGARQRGEKLLELEGGQSLSTSLTMTAFEDLEAVHSVTRDGTVS
jgi:galactose mutarotase-like enzyme